MKNGLVLSSSVRQARRVFIGKPCFRPIPRRSCQAAVLLLAGLMCRAPGWSIPLPQQLHNPSGEHLEVYRNVKSYVDRSTAELVAEIPDLKGLQPVADKEEGEKALGGILGRVGESVRQFFAKFPDITSVEHITMERLGSDGKLQAQRGETFRYLAVVRSEPGVSTLREYRTDMAGNLVQIEGLPQGFVTTEGFASMSIYFLPALRQEAFFRYLGDQKLDGKETNVVAFAQRPGWASIPVRVSMRGQTAQLFVQGLAWIDSASSEIIHMRIDLLAPRPEIGLTGETTEIDFAKVQFPKMPGVALWMPREVTVTTQWEGTVRVETVYYVPGEKSQWTEVSKRPEHLTYRNTHSYSEYGLFGATSKLKY
jgi:hypothetical protein